MIDRYSLPEMRAIWDLTSKFAYYLRVEIAVCEAYSEFGKVPKDALDKIKESGSKAEVI